MTLRFWIEVGVGLIHGTALVVTVVWRDWVELVFHVNPDGGTGAAEWLVVAFAAAFAMTSFSVAAVEWRRRHVLA